MARSLSVCLCKSWSAAGLLWGFLAHHSWRYTWRPWLSSSWRWRWVSASWRRVMWFHWRVQRLPTLNNSYIRLLSFVLSVDVFWNQRFKNLLCLVHVQSNGHPRSTGNLAKPPQRPPALCCKNHPPFNSRFNYINVCCRVLAFSVRPITSSQIPLSACVPTGPPIHSFLSPSSPLRISRGGRRAFDVLQIAKGGLERVSTVAGATAFEGCKNVGRRGEEGPQGCISRSRRRGFATSRSQTFNLPKGGQVYVPELISAMLISQPAGQFGSYSDSQLAIQFGHYSISQSVTWPSHAGQATVTHRVGQPLSPPAGFNHLATSMRLNKPSSSIGPFIII